MCGCLPYRLGNCIPRCIAWVHVPTLFLTLAPCSECLGGASDGSGGWVSAAQQDFGLSSQSLGKQPTDGSSLSL